MSSAEGGRELLLKTLILLLLACRISNLVRVVFTLLHLDRWSHHHRPLACTSTTKLLVDLAAAYGLEFSYPGA